MASKVKKEIKTRNWLAVHAFNRKNGAMPDHKKQRNKNLCRKKMKDV